MNTVLGFLLAAAFILAALGLLAYVANYVLNQLIRAAKLSMTYYDYRRFTHRRNACGANDAREFWPVPVAFSAARQLESMSNNGFVVCGVVLELEGRTFELYSTGEQVHTGLKFKEGIKQ